MNNIGICLTGIIPMRASMSHKSEMISELLFGEIFEIMSHSGDWIKIKMLIDNYEGFINNSSAIHIIKEKKSFDYENSKSFLICENNGGVINVNGKNISVPFGAKIPNFTIDGIDISFDKNICFQKLAEQNLRKTIYNQSIKLLNIPYLWGGRCGWGIDCSGLAQLVYNFIDILLPRDADQQIYHGNTLHFISEAQTGDLVFFDNEDKEITHVGIMIDNKTIIHASKMVRIDKIDQNGIYNEEINRYTHNLRIIKTLI